MPTNDVIKLIKNCPQWQVLRWNMLNLNIMLSKFLATLRRKSYFLSKQLRLRWKSELLIKAKTCIYLKINIYLNQASTLWFRPVLPLYRNQSIDIWSKLKGRFLYNENTELTTAFSIYYFFLHEETLLPQVSNLTSMLVRKHKTQNANWKFSQQKPQIISCSLED